MHAWWMHAAIPCEKLQTLQTVNTEQDEWCKLGGWEVNEMKVMVIEMANTPACCCLDESQPRDYWLVHVHFRHGF